MSGASEIDVTCSSRAISQLIATNNTKTSSRSQTIRTVTSLAKQLTEGLRSLRGSGNSKRPLERKFPIRTKENTKEIKVENTKTNTALQQKQEEAWKLILQKHNHRDSLVNHYRDLRRPNLSERTGWHALSPEAKNTSDTYHHFLQRRALTKVKNVVTNWREIICQNPCCKAKFCDEQCCANKQDKKLASASWDEKHEHLEQSLESLGTEATQWKCGINWEHRNIIDKAMHDVYEDARWRADEGAIAKSWGEQLAWVKEEMEYKLKAEGSSFEDIKWAEDNLKRAEQQEMARLGEQERLQEIKQSSAIIDSDDSEFEASDDDDDFPHLYTNIPTPPRTPIDSPRMEYHETDRSKRLLELLYGSATPPLTPISESEELISSTSGFFNQEIEHLEPGQPFIIIEPAAIRGNDEYELIKALINDLGERLIHYQKHTDETFDTAYETANPEPVRMAPRGHCTWKKHLIADCVKNLLPPAHAIVPNLRVTDPEGKSYFLQEVLPAMDRYSARHIAARDAAQKAMEDWYLENDDISDDEYKAIADHFRQWYEEFGRKDEIIALQERLTQLETATQIQDENDFEDLFQDNAPRSDDNDDSSSDSDDSDTDTVIRRGEDETTNLETARALVSTNDQLLKTLLIDTKMEFREHVRAQTTAHFASKAEDSRVEQDVAIASRFEKTLLKLKKNLWIEGLTSKDWERYEGKEGEGKKYSVEIMGPLAAEWKNVLKEEEKRRTVVKARVMAAASRCSM